MALLTLCITNSQTAHSFIMTVSVVLTMLLIGLFLLGIHLELRLRKVSHTKGTASRSSVFYNTWRNKATHGAYVSITIRLMGVSVHLLLTGHMVNKSNRNNNDKPKAKVQ